MEDERLATLTFLGSAAAVPAIGHDNTYMVIEGSESTLLVDCGGSPLLKLQLAGIEPTQLGHVVFTHSHPDHTYGFPSLMLGLWLLGCQRPLQVYAEQRTLSTLRALLDAFRPEKEWPGFCPPHYHQVTVKDESLVVDLPDLMVTAALAHHLVPNMALKILNKSSGRRIVYSGDTTPSDQVVRLARGAEVLLHEASGGMEGHSSAAQAGQVAQRAGAQRLYLIHYSAFQGDLMALLSEAGAQFSGPVELARDFATIEF